MHLYVHTHTHIQGSPLVAELGSAFKPGGLALSGEFLPPRQVNNTYEYVSLYIYIYIYI